MPVGFSETPARSLPYPRILAKVCFWRDSP
jgi:hypothetical protein